MLKFIITVIIATSAGGLLGYYGKCADGTCPLTANPWRGSVLGLAFGIVLGLSFFQGRKNVENSENIIKIESLDKFNSELSSGKAMIVDFYADWCGPCKRLTPTINELADKLSGQIPVYKVNIDKFPKLAQKYNISSIPNVLFIKGGEVQDSILGLGKLNKYMETAEKHFPEVEEN